MIPPPKLDDRNYHDIVAEAISLIPRYCPDWTNHNPSDPGITLIELAAWMTDLLIYRLNQVPDKNYIAFLNMLGVRLRAPRAAKGIIRFTLVEGAAKQKVPRGTQISTPQASEDTPITFETAHDLMVLPTEPDRLYSYYGELFSDNSSVLNPKRGSSVAVDVFGGAQRVERFLYIGDPRFVQVGEQAVLRLFLGAPEHGGRDLARLLEWEYWNGTHWRLMTPAVIEVERGEVAFEGPLAFAETDVHHVRACWLRGRLVEVLESPQDSELDVIRARVEVSGEGRLPTRAYANLDNAAYLPLDLSKNIWPFGKEPKLDCTMYLACDELTATADAQLAIEFSLADANVVPRPNPSESLLLNVEYWDGKRWRSLGRTNHRGVVPGASDEFGFHDDTKAFAHSGTMTFRRPRDMEAIELNGDTHRWLRVRIENGDYGEPGTYSLENDTWSFRDERPLRPPVMRSIALRYRETYADVKHVLTLNDFEFRDVTDVARTEFTIFQPFLPRADESPALYLGWSQRPSNDKLGIYFQTEEDLGLGAVPADEAEVVTVDLEKYEQLRKQAWEREQRVVWEYWNGTLWDMLAIDDETQGFSSSGFVQIVAPDDWQPSSKFTETRHWLRARLEQGGYVKPPRLRRVLTNCVLAHHHETIRDEVLGSGTALPLQTYQILRRPLLEGEIIEVRERNAPAPEELAELGDQAVRPVGEGGEPNEVWVMWRRVDSFFASGPTSRHYMLDHSTGALSFGDGRRGKAPPEGRNNIVARQYQIGGGEAGNVNPGTLTSLGRSLAYIDGVTNPIAAAGGADRETLAEAKARAPHTIKSRDRAVTAEDFEMLALKASTSLARARCVPDRSNRGHVTVAVLPKADVRGDELARRLVPSNEVLRMVKRYLDERKLVGTVLNVVRPRYRDISLRVVLVRRTMGTSERLRREISLKLRRMLHALCGGREGQGWEFGRPVLKSDLIHVVEEVAGVEGVDVLEIRDEARGVTIEHVRIEEDELPYLVHITVAERVRDEIR